MSKTMVKCGAEFLFYSLETFEQAIHEKDFMFYHHRSSIFAG